MATVLRNPQKLLNSGTFSTSLVTYPDGANRTTDIDAVAETIYHSVRHSHG